MAGSALNKGSGTAIALAGPLDQYAAETLRSIVLPRLKAGEDATLDFSDVDRMHAASLQVLVALGKDLELQGKRVLLSGVRPAVRELFRLSGTEDLFLFTDALR